jgi:hypothetical protein
MSPNSSTRPSTTPNTFASAQSNAQATCPEPSAARRGHKVGEF